MTKTNLNTENVANCLNSIYCEPKTFEDFGGWDGVTYIKHMFKNGMAVRVEGGIISTEKGREFYEKNK